VEFCDNSAVLQGADLAWITSQNNRGRQSAVECMALGLPVIASDLPCLREVIEDGITGFLVAPGEVVQLARRTRMLLDDASLRAHLGNAARAMVEQRFPRQQAVEQWRELYRRVAA
jgi:glycosyltransferase involved in cell wall biosynthesis